MAIGPLLQNFVTNMGITLDGNRVWVSFLHPRLGHFGILCVYASSGGNAIGERADLWRELTDTLDKENQWIMMGDFNMIESPQDQIRGRPHGINGREKGAWSQLLRALKMEDTFAIRVGTLRYNWDNKRHLSRIPLTNGEANSLGRILKRIDRCTGLLSQREMPFLPNHISFRAIALAITCHCSRPSLSEHITRGLLIIRLIAPTCLTLHSRIESDWCGTGSWPGLACSTLTLSTPSSKG